MPTVTVCRQSTAVRSGPCPPRRASWIAGNEFPRAFTYPNPATKPDLPAGYTQFFTDENGTLWYAAANSDTWVIVNTVG